MPTLLTSVFADPDKRPVRHTTEQESIEAKPFIPTAPHVDHNIADTLAYLRYVSGSLPATTIADYANRFIQLSSEMQKLDEAKLPIMMKPGRPQTFPNVVVELARLIPKDTDGSLNSRKDFLLSGLTRSLTLRESLGAYDTEAGLDLTGQKPSAAWVLRRAYRSFSENALALQSFAYELQRALPQNRWELVHIHQDYQRKPKLHERDLIASAPASAPAPIAS